MICRSFACIAVLFGASACCYGDVSELIEYHWNTFSNIDRFQEFYSATNVPAEVRSNILEYQAETFAKMVNFWHPQHRLQNTCAPEAMTNTFKLDWAATDGTNYVVHWEMVPASLEQNLSAVGSWPLTCITTAIRENGGTNLIISTGPCDYPLNDYNQFIQYEIYEANEKLGEVMMSP